MSIQKLGPSAIKLTRICSDPKKGDWYAFGSSRGWIEIRVTPTGYMRASEVKKGQHPYFTPEEK
jgi:hypothetical protein